jgi:2-oxoglutarate ferredoxin oxidoreductase subunit beta
MALELGATFVARSFSGDKTQLVPLIKAALSHKGFALIDVMSPCVTFNNNAGSTKSYDYVRDHIEALAEIGFVPEKEEITVSYETGTTVDVELHDGSVVHLQKLADGWDPRDRQAAMRRLQAAKTEGEILTGLLYIDPNSKDLHEVIKSDSRPLNSLKEEDLCPGSAILDLINEDFR